MIDGHEGNTEWLDSRMRLLGRMRFCFGAGVYD